MNNGNAHVCRQCEKPLDPPEPIDVQDIAPRVEDAQPAGTPQKAVRKKRKKKTAQHRTSPSASKEPGQSNNAAVNGDALPTEAGAFAQSMSTLVRLDEIYNGEVEPTHPMCEQCTDTLIETVDQRIEETESELRDHEAFYEIVNKDEQEDSGEPSLDELRAELARVEAEDEALKKLCKEAMAERDAVFRKRDLMRKEQERLEKSYDQGQKEYMLLKHGWFAAKQEFDSALNQLSYQEHQRKLLTEISVPKAVFRIETKGHIGRINGFRFGKTKTIKTEWKEINFAWGEAVFLLDYLARMFEFEFEEYVLIPYKDTSRIEVLERRSKPLPLFILMQHDVDHMARYDQAQSAFAECISKLARRIEKQYPDFRLSNPISDGRIHEPFSGMSYSFALSANGPESWTRALRLILKNLDQMLNFYVDRVHDKRRQNAKSSVR